VYDTLLMPVPLGPKIFKLPGAWEGVFGRPCAPAQVRSPARSAAGTVNVPLGCGGLAQSAADMSDGDAYTRSAHGVL
jgi:hypothetical protein